MIVNEWSGVETKHARRVRFAQLVKLLQLILSHPEASESLVQLASIDVHPRIDASIALHRVSPLHLSPMC